MRFMGASFLSHQPDKKNPTSQRERGLIVSTCNLQGYRVAGSFQNKSFVSDWKISCQTKPADGAMGSDQGNPDVLICRLPVMMPAD
jgi:hypothetical protein